MTEMETMLEIEDVTVQFDTAYGIVRAADHVGYSVGAGEVVGVVGESGSGKSVTAQTILGLLKTPPARIVSGSVRFEGRELIGAPSSIMRRIRGKEIGLISQEPIAALNPLLPVGFQIAEAITAHDRRANRTKVRRRVVELLESVQVPNAAERVSEYPHQFSGGMAQRVAIAMAMANNPRLLIADEPTTALDVTVQAQVLRQLRTAQESTGAAMILISHDLGLIAEFAHRIVVMYAGRVVETGTTASVFANPSHPYTRGLLASIPRIDERATRLSPIPGQPPQLHHQPSGCAFHPRCSLSNGRIECRTVRPELQQTLTDQCSACHFFEELQVIGHEKVRVP
jgi:oligopeptide/dipeptide ABC transporter ATP-binding protein